MNYTGIAGKSTQRPRDKKQSKTICTVLSVKLEIFNPDFFKLFERFFLS